MKLIIFAVILLAAYSSTISSTPVADETDLLSKIAAAVKRVRRGAVGPKWPTKRIPFAFSNIIDFDFDERIVIKNVLKQIQESLAVNGDVCIEFVERTNEKDYILFVDKGDCSSGIGYFTGLNNISINKACFNTGTIIHEVLHRLVITLKRF